MSASYRAHRLGDLPWPLRGAARDMTLQLVKNFLLPRDFLIISLSEKSSRSCRGSFLSPAVR